MQLINKPLQIWHYPQVPCEPFKVDVKDEYEAYKIYNVLADQHLWLEENRFIPDYCNSISLVMYDDSEWVSYYNNHEDLDETLLFEQIESELSTK